MINNNDVFGLLNDFQTKALVKIANYYNQFQIDKQFKIREFKNEMSDLAQKQIENIQIAVANTLTSKYQEQMKQDGIDADVKRLKNNPFALSVVSSSIQNITKATNYALWYSAITYSNLISMKKQDADSKLEQIVDRGLPGGIRSNNAVMNYVAMGEAISGDAEINMIQAASAEIAAEKKQYLIYIPRTFSACSKCSPWQGRYLIDDIHAKGQPDGKHPLLSEAFAAGFFHPNCRDTWIYVTEETDKPPVKEPKHLPENNLELKRRYAAERRQRELERTIRANKVKIEAKPTRKMMNEYYRQKDIDPKTTKLVFSDSYQKQSLIDWRMKELRDMEKAGLILRVEQNRLAVDYKFAPKKEEQEIVVELANATS